MRPTHWYASPVGPQPRWPPKPVGTFASRLLLHGAAAHGRLQAGSAHMVPQHGTCSWRRRRQRREVRASCPFDCNSMAHLRRRLSAQWPPFCRTGRGTFCKRVSGVARVLQRSVAESRSGPGDGALPRCCPRPAIARLGSVRPANFQPNSRVRREDGTSAVPGQLPDAQPRRVCLKQGSSARPPQVENPENSVPSVPQTAE